MTFSNWLNVGRAHSDLLLNNLCEVFNGKIVDGRDRPIISALEYIREYIMKRIVTVQRLIEKTEGSLTPTAQALLDVAKDKASQCTCIYTGNGKYQVAGEYLDQFVVNMNTRECTCRKWEITCIPCKHAICALWDMGEHGDGVTTPEDLVHPCYSMEVWRRVYSHTVEPINGPDMWVEGDYPTKLTHPKHHKQIGRPKKKRRKGNDETVTQGTQNNSNGTKLSRQYISVTCGKCKNKGHNSRTCKGYGGNEGTGGGEGSGGGRGRGRGVGNEVRTSAATVDNVVNGRGRLGTLAALAVARRNEIRAELTEKTRGGVSGIGGRGICRRGGGRGAVGISGSEVIEVQLEEVVVGEDQLEEEQDTKMEIMVLELTWENRAREVVAEDLVVVEVKFKVNLLRFNLLVCTSTFVLNVCFQQWYY